MGEEEGDTPEERASQPQEKPRVGASLVQGHAVVFLEDVLLQLLGGQAHFALRVHDLLFRIYVGKRIG